MKTLLLTILLLLTLTACTVIERDDCYYEDVCYDEYVGTILGIPITRVVCYEEYVCYY